MMPIKKNEPTVFSARVYELLKQIPEGRVVTYKALAEALDCRSAQAVGQALKRNPFAPAVPCHRVIRSDMSIGGYHGQVSGPTLQRKLALLRTEGVEFHNGVLTEPDRLYDFNKCKKERLN